MDYYDSEYRRQYCRERINRIGDDYRRAQGRPGQRRERVAVAWMRSMWDRVRAQVPERVPVYRS